TLPVFWAMNMRTVAIGLRLLLSLVVLIFCLFGACRDFNGSVWFGAIAAELAAVLNDPGMQWMIFLCTAAYLVGFCVVQLRPVKDKIGEDCKGLQERQPRHDNFYLLALVTIVAARYALDYSQAATSTRALTL